MRRPSLTLVLAAALLVLGLDYATFAATGDSLLVGKASSASRTTTLQNTGAGPALTLKNKPAAPPLSVNSTKRVAKLNADLVDGKHATDLGVRTLSYATSLVFLDDAAELDILTGVVPKGRYLLTISGTISHGTGGLEGHLYNESTSALLATAAAPPSSAGLYDLGLSAVVTVTEASKLRYEVDAPAEATFLSPPGVPIQISFTSIDQLKTRNANHGAPQN